MKLTLALLFTITDHPFPFTCIALIGGWCETYSAKNSILSVFNSNVSNNNGLNGFPTDFSATDMLLTIKQAIRLILRIGSGSAAAKSKISEYS